MFLQALQNKAFMDLFMLFCHNYSRRAKKSHPFNSQLVIEAQSLNMDFHNRQI